MQIYCCQFQTCSQSCEKRLQTSSCLSVCPSVYMEPLGSLWTDFDEVWYLSIPRKSVEKIQVPLTFVLLCSVISSANRAFYEGNTCRFGRVQMNIWPFCIAFWITKATNTHSQCVMLTGLLYNNVFFYVLLTVRLSTILKIDQLNAQNLEW